MEEAPNENPEITFRIINKPFASSMLYSLLKTINSTLIPITPKETTPKPITAPPEKATSRALLSEVRAACVVLTFALVAMRMPMNPAKADIKAPTTKDKATNAVESVSASPLNTNKTATAKIKTTSTLYSAFKNDMAPSAIFLAILAIFSVPTSCLMTQADLKYMNTNPRTPERGIK